jgi:ATP-dependent helicase/nuclease subunit A
MPESVLQDQAARDQIVQNLDTNMMILAGAGAGKTHELIERIAATVMSGKCEIDRLAAITFTRKAAGEMRGRLFAKLRQEADDTGARPGSPVRRALDKIDQCFVGTIHSFCARLLRERPIEAQLPPDFAEVDDRQEALISREAWDRFVQQALSARDPRLGGLSDLGLQPEDLYAFFRTRCVFGELALKPPDDETPDLAPAVRRATAFVEEAAGQIPVELPEGPDDAILMIRRARRYLHYRKPASEADRAEFLRILSGSPTITQRKWGSEGKAYAKQLKDELLPDLKETVINPALAAWHRYVYRSAAPIVDDAARFYDGVRTDLAQATFQDLLVKAAALLRGNPRVRADFQSRYQRLFVDEFQDTDPVQAELLLYLAGQEPDEADWRRLTPRPGSLFLVGDEKQSIYRFRRADVDTFRLVRDRIEQTGGQVLQLNTSFRSLGRLCGWINGAFAPLFGEYDAAYQPEFAPLLKQRDEGMDQVCVRRLTVGKITRNLRDGIAALEAGRIADFIGSAVQGHSELNAQGDGALLAEKASPGDFMVLTRTRKCLHLYARALEDRGIPYDIVGSGGLGDSAELASLVGMLSAVHAPDDPVTLVAYLRGPLVGLGDDDLYRYRQEGGSFNYREQLPEGLPGNLSSTLHVAYGQLRELADRLDRLAPSVAIEVTLESLGLTAFSAGLPMGSSRAGNLVRVLERVRVWEDRGMHWGQVLGELCDLIEDPEYRVEEMTLEAGRPDVVRIMNLHQAKGLQADVVFLADAGDGRSGNRTPTSHVSRRHGQPCVSAPAFRYRGPHASEVIAEPPGWEQDAEEEGRYLAAEELRLLYVAATRARNLLVVSVYDPLPDRGPWGALSSFLDSVPELEAATPADPDPVAVADIQLERWRAERTTRLARVQEPTYAVTRVTTGDEGDEAVAEVIALEGESRGKEYGNLLHRVFEDAVAGRLPEREDDYLAALVGGETHEGDWALKLAADLDVFRASDLWHEIQASDRVFTEVPFGCPATGGDANTVMRGVIDLVYRSPEGWKIVDYKSDPVSSRRGVSAVVDRYRDQVMAYAHHWQEMAGEPVASAGLWLSEDGGCVLL